MSNTHKKGLYLTIVYCCVLVISILLYVFGIGNSWQEKITDRFFTKRQPQQNIVVLAIDDESIQKVGQWPWPREVFAKVLTNISNARVVGMDVNFTDASRLGSSDDDKLAQALKSFSKINPVVLPFQLEARGRVADKPLAIFEPYIEQTYANITVDGDGIARYLTTNMDDFESMSARIAALYPPERQIIFPSTFRIDYSGPEKTFLTIPIIDVINNKVPPHTLDKAIVLIGATAPDLHDYVNTPFGLMPGVEVHANAIENILNAHYLEPFSKVLGCILTAILDLIALILIVFVRRFFILLGSLIILLGGINILGISLFSYKIIFPNLYISLSFIVICILGILFQYVRESGEKKFIRKAFQRYLSAELVDQLVKNPEKLVLGGEKRRVSILFSDIRGFTTIAESMTPEVLTSFMSDYFNVVSDIVLDNRGILDKYIGDAIMAFWGAPLLNPNHTRDACTVALHMIENVKKQNELWKAKGLPAITIGIGVSSGDVVVGNMGSRKRFNYGIVGDEVNFTSRLEGLTKEYGVNCIVSEATKKDIESVSGMYTRELDIVRVKGKKEPKKIFELITKDMTDVLKKQLDHFEKGRQHYAKGEWDAAILEFKEVLDLGEDGPAKVFLERSINLKNNSPHEWTGIYDFKTK